MHDDNNLARRRAARAHRLRPLGRPCRQRYVHTGGRDNSTAIQARAELATELVVLSLGPVQPFTAGPLRVFLLCDGEQVLSVQVESGHAHARYCSQAMLQAEWQQALPLASTLDPLAPLACQLAYVQAIEQLQGWRLSPPIVALREAALALERARNHLWWLVGFMRLLAVAQLSDRASQLAPPPSSC